MKCSKCRDAKCQEFIYELQKNLYYTWILHANNEAWSLGKLQAFPQCFSAACNRSIRQKTASSLSCFSPQKRQGKGRRKGRRECKVQCKVQSTWTKSDIDSSLRRKSQCPSALHYPSNYNGVQTCIRRCQNSVKCQDLVFPTCQLWTRCQVWFNSHLWCHKILRKMFRAGKCRLGPKGQVIRSWVERWLKWCWLLKFYQIISTKVEGKTQG